MHQLEPVLVANRGEIAVRIARTVHRLGLRSATMHTAADADARHLDAADVSVAIGSYLSIEDVLDAARRAGARSVHPGYGFLSESAELARAVIDAGLGWVGPPPQAIELMGDKAAAKAAALRAGVPVVPDGQDGSFPVIVKALAGGGGKGMRVVHGEAELEPALAAARREAQAAFGDDRVMIERYLERPRHIEIQVLGDRHGSVVHFGERECSLQRRHQKVIEEAPSAAVGPELRARMGAAAVALAASCGYEGAGTVEFILPAGEAEEFFFLEMNTRLQVEHPVTELVYGVDLVELGLRVAAGEALARVLGPEDLEPSGHAIEARLYAEDPAAGFLPATGRILRLREPAGVRVDSGVREGDEVGTAFDPMLAKVIAHGADREQAVGRLHRALGELELLGVPTNAAFSRSLLEREDVRRGELDTGLLERILEAPLPAVPEDLLPAAAWAMFAADTAELSVAPGPWRRMLEEHGEVEVRGQQVRARERSWTVAAARGGDPGTLRLCVDGVSRRYAVAREADAVWVGRDGQVLVARPARADRGPGGPGAGSLEAPMPGTVLLVHVAEGSPVGEGDVLLVLESMKMELQITAPRSGVVAGLALAPGDRVARGQPLLAVVDE